MIWNWALQVEPRADTGSHTENISPQRSARRSQELVQIRSHKSTEATQRHWKSIPDLLTIFFLREQQLLFASSQRPCVFITMRLSVLLLLGARAALDYSDEEALFEDQEEFVNREDGYLSSQYDSFDKNQSGTALIIL